MSLQRHCRLKHNGDINIELIEKRNSNKRTYVRLNCPNSSGQRSINHHDIIESASSDDVQEHHTISKSPNVTQPPTYHADKCNQSVNYSTDCSDGAPKNMEIDSEDTASKSLSNQSNPPNQLIQLLNKKPKRYQCTSCPYVSPCRSQLESHNKFHNLNECGTFQCRHCSYNVTKKHLLYQHQKMHEYEKTGRDETNEDSSASEAIDLTSSLTKSDHEKQLMFCSYCPARYLNEKELRGHLKMHASFFPYRCAVCTYTSRQESYIETHMNVHSSSYQQKTKFMINEFDIRSDYPQPQLSSIPPEIRDENALWIVSEFNPKQRLNVGSTNDAIDIDLDEMILSTKVPNKTFTSPQKISCKPSTSVDNTATLSPPHKTILQTQGGLQNRESKQNKIVISKPEKCPHCPFCTTKPDVLKEHMQCHISVSGIENQKNCDHCDYSVSDELVLKEHVKLHFSSSSLSPTLLSNRKSVAFFTCYDGLMLSSNKSESDGCDGSDTRPIYPIAGDQELEESASDKENKKIIVDINTGEEIK